ncbi:MAG: hypothetical protein ACOYN0_14590 [Phycisphaerales bacterium]
MPCAECGEPLGENSVRPAWLEPERLGRLRRAALRAAVASFALALLPLLAAAVGPSLPNPPGSLIDVAIASVAVVMALVPQTVAGIRLARLAPSTRERNRLLAIVVIRVPLFLMTVLSTMVLLLSHAFKMQVPGGTYSGATSWLLQQAAITIPAVVADVLISRAARNIAKSVSDERPAWRHLDVTFIVATGAMSLAGLLCVLPSAAWVSGPMLLIVCEAAVFAAVARTARLHLDELAGGSTLAR